MVDVIFDYVEPPGASELGKQRLSQLANLAVQRRVNLHKPKPGQPEHATLEREAMNAGLGTSRFYGPRSKTLVNTKCLISQILQAADLGDAVPSGWEELQPQVKKPKLTRTPFQDAFFSLPIAEPFTQEVSSQEVAGTPQIRIIVPSQRHGEGGHAKQLGPCRERSINPHDTSK